MGLNRKQRDEPTKLDRKWRGPPKTKSGWREQEQLGAEMLPKGKKVRGSGCATSPHKRSDAFNAVFRQEAKTTGQESLAIQREWLEAITAQAHATGRVPMLLFGFDGMDPAARTPSMALGHVRTPPMRLDWGGFPRVVAKRLLAVFDAVQDGDLARAQEVAALIPRRNG
jgi:hypothetical protein